MTRYNRISLNLISIIFGMLISSTISVGLGGASHNSMYLPDATAQPTIPDFNFAAAGDWGCTFDTINTVNNIIDKNPELVLALRDLSYNNNVQCWLNIIDPIAEKTKITIGNHEVDSTKKLEDYMKFFGLEKQYYSFNHQNVHLLQSQQNSHMKRVLSNTTL